MANRNDNALNQRLLEVGLTQEQLAEFMGVQRSTIYRWATKRVLLSPKDTLKLSLALDLSLPEMAKLFGEPISTYEAIAQLAKIRQNLGKNPPA